MMLAAAVELQVHRFDSLDVGRQGQAYERRIQKMSAAATAGLLEVIQSRSNLYMT